MFYVLAGILLLCSSPASPLGEDNFTAFKQMVYEYIEVCEAFVLPTDNSDALRTNDATVKYFGTFDFIIVGSGAAGSVLASRLTEISNWTVLVLEAGEIDDDVVKCIGLSGYAATTIYNWGYQTTVQEHGCLGYQLNFGDRCDATRGKVLGGSTNVNAAVYSRGHPEDYNRWEEVYGCTGWSYEEVLPYFKKSEDAQFENAAEPYRGYGGYIPIVEQVDSIMTGPLIEAFEELGYPYDDYNGPYSNRVSRYQMALKGNERVSSSTAFLKPFLNRNNLILSVESIVTKVHVDNGTKRAYGVQFVKDGTNYTANVTKDVILSAGGYNSAQILLLSGIGPREDLEKLDIPVFADLPVGRNLQDHLSTIKVLPTTFFTLSRTNQTINNYTLDEKLWRYVNHQLPLMGNVDTVAFLNLAGNDTKRPDVEHYLTIDANASTDLTQVNSISDISFRTSLLHPKFRGAVTLQSRNPVDFPVIDLPLFSEIEDIETIYRLQQSIISLNNTEALKKVGGSFYFLEYSECPQEMYSETWWYCVIRRSTKPNQHPVGTNSMGNNKTVSVVNPRGRVHGFLGLVVADESVIPEATSGHNMAPTIMVAERIADFIKEDYGQL